MKKLIAFLLAAIMLLSLCACGKESTPADTEAPATPKEDFYGAWTNCDTGDTITIEENYMTLEYADGGSYRTDWRPEQIDGDTFKGVNPFGEMKLSVVDGMKQLSGSLGTFIPADAAAEKRLSESVPVGEKYAGENLEITIKSTEFAEFLDSDNTTRMFERDVSWENAGDGKVFMIIKFDFTNLSKQVADMPRDLKMTVQYKDGYEFSSFDEEKAYLFEDDINGVFRKCCLDSGGYVMELSPLTSGSYFIAIPVAEIVSTDTDSPLYIQVDFGENIKGGASVEETALYQVQ